MTPDEAQRAINDAEALRSNIPAYCWRALEFVAGTREEWGVEVTHYHDGDLHTRWGYDDRKDAEAFARYMGRDPRWNAARVVRRYVTEPEEA